MHAPPLRSALCAALVLATLGLGDGCGPTEQVELGTGLESSAAAGAADTAGAAGAADTAGAAGASGALGVEPDEGDAGSLSADGSPRVLAFILVDATTGLDLRVLKDGDTIDLSGGPLTLRADIEPTTPASVNFYVDDKRVLTEDIPPWFLTGVDAQDQVVAWQVSPGSREVRATPHLEAGGKGARGTSLEQTFRVIQ